MTAEDRFRRIYRSQADSYEALVAREDGDGNLLPALRRLAALDGDLVEFGAGTGRLTRLLAPSARSVRAFDASPAMLTLARKLSRIPEIAFAAARNHALPARSASADLALAGWTFGHAVGWNPQGWEAELDACLAEMARVLRPGGTAVVIETLGTGRSDPAPPNEGLAALYRRLEACGFRPSWIRTDYLFPDRSEADRLCQGFFGTTFPLVQEAAGWRLPECTGLWSRRKPSSIADG